MAENCSLFCDVFYKTKQDENSRLVEQGNQSCLVTSLTSEVCGRKWSEQSLQIKSDIDNDAPEASDDARGTSIKLFKDISLRVVHCHLSPSLLHTHT